MYVSKKSRAYHEAGHAVIARLGRIEIDNVSIIPTMDRDGSALLGAVTWTETREEWFLDKHAAKIKALLAGGIAQERAGFDVGVGDMQDGFDIEHLAGAWTNPWLDDEDEDGCVFLTIAEAARVKRLKKQTEALVTRHWPSIKRVAEALSRRRVLYQDDVDTLMACDRAKLFSNFERRERA